MAFDSKRTNWKGNLLKIRRKVRMFKVFMGVKVCNIGISTPSLSYKSPQPRTFPTFL